MVSGLGGSGGTVSTETEAGMPGGLVVTRWDSGNTWVVLWKRWGSTVHWGTKSSPENLEDDGGNNLFWNMGAWEPGGSGHKTCMKEAMEGLLLLSCAAGGSGWPLEQKETCWNEAFWSFICCAWCMVN